MSASKTLAFELAMARAAGLSTRHSTRSSWRRARRKKYEGAARPARLGGRLIMPLGPFPASDVRQHAHQALRSSSRTSGVLASSYRRMPLTGCLAPAHSKGQVEHLRERSEHPIGPIGTILHREHEGPRSRVCRPVAPATFCDPSFGRTMFTSMAWSSRTLSAAFRAGILLEVV